MRRKNVQFPSRSTPKDGPGASATRGGARYGRIDALRGFALIWMAVFHFCFDLSNFRLLNTNFYLDPFWLWQRTCILSLFLLCAGAGQAVAVWQGQSWARFWRRWGQIVGCALLVTFGSWLMFPDSYIYFGVLHGMAVMLIVARLLATRSAFSGGVLPGSLIVAGVILVALPQFFSAPFFDTKWTDWVGLVTHKPITEDYVPVMPWLGVMLWGLVLTRWMLASRPAWLNWSAAAPSQAHDLSRSGDNIGPVRGWHALRAGLAWLGGRSLTFYMVHQPVLIGSLLAWMKLTGRPIPH
jgi:uncharacterized membrane protein